MQKRRPGQQSVTQKHRVKQCHVCSNFFLGEHDLKQHEDGIRIVARDSVATSEVVVDPGTCEDGEGVKGEGENSLEGVEEEISKADTTCGVCNLQNDKLDMIKVTPILHARDFKTFDHSNQSQKLLSGNC